MAISQATRAQVRSLAAGATPGPWRWAHILDGIEARAILDGNGYHFARCDDVQNGEYIAAVNPTFTLGVLEKLDRVESLLDEARSEIQYLLTSADPDTDEARELLRKITRELGK